LIRSYPDFPMIYRWSAAALGQLGRTAEAKEALEKAISRAPAAFDMYVRTRAPWFRPEDHAHLVKGLSKAGWKGWGCVWIRRRRPIRTACGFKGEYPIWGQSR
jgi:adenylate cyclase